MFKEAECMLIKKEVFLLIVYIFKNICVWFRKEIKEREENN